VASESHASTPLPTFATANLVEPQRAKDRHWHYTNTLDIIPMKDFFSLNFNTRKVDLLLKVTKPYDPNSLINGEYSPTLLELKKSQGRYEADMIRLQDTFNFVISENMYSELKQARLTGWKTYITKIDSLEKEYCGFQVFGKCGPPIRPNKPGFVKGYQIDFDSWDKNDFFIPETTLSILCSFKAKTILDKLNLPSLEITNIKDLEWYNA